MTKKYRGNTIHGWVVLDKDKNISSAQLVGEVKHILNANKVGHSGTLDPLATGVLPLAFGEATKTISYIMDSIKKYEFIVRWGESRDTDDAEGVVTGKCDVRPSKEEVESALPFFTGEVLQTPPMYSAIRIKGERAYNLARQNKAAKMKARSVHVKYLELLKVFDNDSASFAVTCGKGFYVRALARDLAKYLGTLGYISSLRRTRVGPFKECNAISLETLKEIGHKFATRGVLWPVEVVLDDIPAMALTKEEANRLRCGQRITIVGTRRHESLAGIADGEVVCAKENGKIVALTKFVNHEIRPFRVLNY